MGRGLPGAILKALRAQNFFCTVTKVWQHTPTMRALRISSPQLIETVKPQEGEFLRCWFPEIDKPNRESMRGYTMVDIDYHTGEFTFFALLHTPSGPGSHWLSKAQVNDSFEATYYSSHPLHIPNPAPQGFAFLADAAGTPYVNAILSQVGADFPAQVWLLEWHHSDREIPIVSPGEVTIEWITPTTDAALEKVRAWDWSTWYPHLICESKTLLPVRRFLLKEVGIPKDRIHSQAYWIRGKSMGNSREGKPLDIN